MWRNMSYMSRKVILTKFFSFRNLKYVDRELMSELRDLEPEQVKERLTNFCRAVKSSDIEAIKDSSKGVINLRRKNKRQKPYKTRTALRIIKRECAKKCHIGEAV